jgi:DNA-binding response OmpR family regulator
MQILIADDDNASRTLLAAHLRKWGYEAVSVSDGKAAWAALTAPDAPRIAILDWMMPGMDGIEVCRRARLPEHNLMLYVILLTARDNKQDILNGLDAGADDYITKPFDPDDLRVRVRVGQRVANLQAALETRVTQLQDALAHVKTLQGLLPICAKCHRIRDDKMTWLNLERYIEQHSEARLSHGLCPLCYQEELRQLEIDADRLQRDRRAEEDIDA